MDPTSEHVDPSPKFTVPGYRKFGGGNARAIGGIE